MKLGTSHPHHSELREAQLLDPVPIAGSEWNVAMFEDSSTKYRL